MGTVVELDFAYVAPEFRAWPKIPRLFRDVTITEKIDGTNAAIGILEYSFGTHAVDELRHRAEALGACVILGSDRAEDGLPEYEYLVYAQSRKRLISPESDNFGFAGWVRDNAQALVSLLGEGVHFGEWWGSGIQRGYGLTNGERRFSLFNTKRWDGADLSKHPEAVPGLHTVPVLYQGEFSTEAVRGALQSLSVFGSEAEPGFERPEGVVVYHDAANQAFKVTLEHDEEPKEVAARRRQQQAA